MNTFAEEILNGKETEMSFGNSNFKFNIVNDNIEIFIQDSKKTEDFNIFLNTFCCDTFDDCDYKIIGITPEDSVHCLYEQINCNIQGFDPEKMMCPIFVSKLFDIYPTISIISNNDPRFSLVKTYSFIKDETEGSQRTFYLDTNVKYFLEKTYENIYNILENECLNSMSI